MANRKSKISQVPLDRSKPHHKGTIYVQGVPETTRANFKACCAEMGITMRDQHIKMMRTFVDYVRSRK